MAGLLGSKLDAFVENGGAFYGLAVEAQNNFRYPRAIIALALAFPFAGRLLSPPLGGLAFADLLAPAVCWAMATFRIGCLLEGCCFGVPSRLPWALPFRAGSHAWADEVAKGLPPSAPASLPVHPLELYFLLFAFRAGAFLLWLQPRKRYDGQVVLLFLALHEPGKFLLEFLRAQPAPHLQVLSLAFAVIAWGALLGRSVVAITFALGGGGSAVAAPFRVRGGESGKSHSPSAARRLKPGLQERKCAGACGGITRSPPGNESPGSHSSKPASSRLGAV